MNQAHKVYIGEIELPVTPSKITIETENRNETIDLVNQNVMSNLKRDGLFAVSFDFLIPLYAAPFVNEAVLKPASFYIDYLKSLKEQRKNFQFIVTRANRTNTNIKMNLESWSCEESAEGGNDSVFSISLREYRQWANMEVDVSLNHHLVQQGIARGWR